MPTHHETSHGVPERIRSHHAATGSELLGVRDREETLLQCMNYHNEYPQLGRAHAFLNRGNCYGSNLSNECLQSQPDHAHLACAAPKGPVLVNFVDNYDKVAGLHRQLVIPRGREVVKRADLWGLKCNY
jgi:hypothetical protein